MFGISPALLNSSLSSDDGIGALFQHSELGAWYDIQDLSTIWTDTSATTPADEDDYVARIDDKSGNGNTLLQTTPAARPQLKKTANGKYYLKFSGAQFLASSSANGASIAGRAVLYGAAARFETTAVDQTVLGRLTPSTGPDRAGLFVFTAGSVMFGAQRSGSGFGAFSASATKSANTDYVILGYANATSTDVVLRIDGSVAGSLSRAADFNTTSVSRQIEMGGWDGVYLTGRIYGGVIRLVDIDLDDVGLIETEFSKLI